jgi:hypothetical protein
MFITNREYFNHEDESLLKYINTNFINIPGYQIDITLQDINSLLKYSKITTVLHFQLEIDNCQSDFFNKNINPHISTDNDLILLVTTSADKNVLFISKLLEEIKLLDVTGSTILGTAYDENISSNMIDFKLIGIVNE